MNYSDYIKHYRRDAETYEYQKPFSSPEGQSNRRRATLIRRIIDKSLGNSKARIVDIGAGGGALVREIAMQGVPPIGLDIALLNLQRIANNLQKENITGFSLVCGDAYTLPFKNESMDAVIFSEVLEHLENPEKALAEAARILKSGGQLIASVPYKEKILYHLCVHCNQLTPSNAHLHSFDEKKLESLFQGLPFIIEKKIFFQNKFLQMANIHYHLRFLPHSLWRFVDRLMNFVIRKPYYMVIALRKKRD